MAAISDLPMLHDIDADYSPQYVKLARILRGKIESGEYHRGDILPAAELASQYKVSVRVTCSALAMLAAGFLRETRPHLFAGVDRSLAGVKSMFVSSDRILGSDCGDTHPHRLGR